MLWGIGPAQAADYPWRNHAAPFDFIFGNDFDTHQQSRATRNGGLFGFLYIRYTGEATKDDLRVAVHTDCSAVPDCRVGWILKGELGVGTFLYRAAEDQPVWLVTRAEIPQPGAYAHFHWLGTDPAPGEHNFGYFLELQAVDSFCFVHPAKEGMEQATCEAGGGVEVVPGIDIATHVNIVTSVSEGASGM